MGPLIEDKPASRISKPSKFAKIIFKLRRKDKEKNAGQSILVYMYRSGWRITCIINASARGKIYRYWQANIRTGLKSDNRSPS